MKFFVIFTCVLGIVITQLSSLSGKSKDLAAFFKENAPVPRYATWTKININQNSLLQNKQPLSQNDFCEQDNIPQISYSNQKYNILNLQQETNQGIRNAARGQKVQETLKNFDDQRESIKKFLESEKQKSIKLNLNENRQDVWQFFENYPPTQVQIAQMKSPRCKNRIFSQQLQSQFQIQSAPQPQTQVQLNPFLIIAHSIETSQQQQTQQCQSKNTPQQPTLLPICPKPQPTSPQVPQPSNSQTQVPAPVQNPQPPSQITQVYVMPLNETKQNQTIKIQPIKSETQPPVPKPPKVNKPAVIPISPPAQPSQPPNQINPVPVNPPSIIIRQVSNQSNTTNTTNGTVYNSSAYFQGQYPGKEGIGEPGFSPYVPPKYPQINVKPKVPPQFVDEAQIDQAPSPVSLRTTNVVSSKSIDNNQKASASLAAPENTNAGSTAQASASAQVSRPIPPLPKAIPVIFNADDPTPRPQALDQLPKKSAIPQSVSIPTFPLPVPVQINPSSVPDKKPNDVWYTNSTSQ